MSIQNIDIPQTEVSAFCKRWRVSELALFGSVLRDDFGPDSDVDVLVRFESQAHHTLLDMVRIETDLARILGRDVHLIDRAGVEQSRNYIRRAAILDSAVTIYAA